MIVAQIHQEESGRLFFQAYGSMIVYDPQSESVEYWAGYEYRRDITAFYPEKPNLDEFEAYCRRYVEGVT